MLRPARMTQFNALIFDTDVDRATTAIIHSGLVHLVRIADVQHWADQAKLQSASHDDTPLLLEIKASARSLAENLGVSPDVVSESAAFAPFDPAAARRTLHEITKAIKPALGERYAAWQKLASLQQTRQQATTDIRTRFGLDLPSRYTMLEVALGYIPDKNVDLLKNLLSAVPNVVLSFPEPTGKVSVMAIVLRKDREILRQARDKVDFAEAVLPDNRPPSSEDLLSQLDDRIAKAGDELAKADDALQRSRDAHSSALRAVLSQVSLHQLAASAKGQFTKTARTYVISGWTPSRTAGRVVEALRSACQNRCLVDLRRAQEVLAESQEPVEVPSVFENPKLLKPFEMLVSSYGPPAYNSIDPTLIVAPTFLVMYGAMFGDVGQGLVLVGVGLLLSLLKRLNPSIRQIGHLLMWCGAAAVLFGFLYGSVFGVRSLLPYRGFEPVENVGAFLTIALFFGTGMVSLGLLLNAITALSRKEWAAGFFHWKGLMGIAFYWVGVALLIQGFSGRPVNTTLIVALVAMPILASVAVALAQGRDTSNKLPPPQRGFAGRLLKSFGHIVGDSFDTILQFITNTLSFLRIAAFAIAHAALFIALFSLADLLRGGGPSLPILVHVVGNAGMIALEGLVVCVQALRLTYYEFFGKFFRVGKTIFSPVKLSNTVP